MQIKSINRQLLFSTLENKEKKESQEKTILDKPKILFRILELIYGNGRGGEKEIQKKLGEGVVR